MVSPITQPLAPVTEPLASAATPSPTAPLGRSDRAHSPVRFWEPGLIFFITFVILATFTPRVTAYLSPPTGDEPFYLMTAISLIRDGDLNECNNFINHDESLIYPTFYGIGEDGKGYVRFPKTWVGFRGSPYPLPPHPAVISPASRQCASKYTGVYPIDYDNPGGELYSKHGLGLSLMILPAFGFGGRTLVVFFLNIIGALVALNIYLLVRESIAKAGPAIFTWLAFAFTAPQLPYSYLIFTELPAALLMIYAFRRIRAWDNNVIQVIGIGLCAAFLPWLHYRYAPICIGLAVYYIFQLRKHSEQPRRERNRNNVILTGIVSISAILLMLMFYARYGVPWPNGSDHAGISDLGGSARGAVGLFLDQQWGLFIAAPIYILAIAGIIMMWQNKDWRSDLKWIAVVAIPYFLVIATYAQWWGEWCPPARYLAPIMPLLALPFALVLANINSIFFKAIYGVLLLLSLMTSWGFLYQPQWMYNQPDGESLLLLNGLPTLGEAVGVPFLQTLNVTPYLPSFVKPYFAYYVTEVGGEEEAKALGDAASRDAWVLSLGPILFIIAIVALCIALARIQARRDRNRQSLPDDLQSEGGGDSGSTYSTGDREPGGAAISAGFRQHMITPILHTFEYIGFLLGRALKQPALAWAGLSPMSAQSTQFGFKTETSGTTGQDPATTQPNGSHEPAQVQSTDPQLVVDTEPEAQTTVVEALAPIEDATTTEVVASAPVAAEAKKPRGGLLGKIAGYFLRTRGLWLGAVAIGLAMYAQKLVTVDRDILQSIRWYALAIAVMLFGWFGTYRTHSSLADPGPRKIKSKKVVETAAVEVVPVEPGANGSTPHAEPVAEVEKNVPQLPTRKRVVLGETTTAVEPPASSAPTAPTTTLPVRTRSANGTVVITQPVVTKPQPAKRFVMPSMPSSNLSRHGMGKRLITFGKVWWRYVLAFFALGINIYSATLLRADYFSTLGGYGWLASLGLLALAFIREPKHEVKSLDGDKEDIEDKAALKINRWVEIGIVVGIMALALALRLYRLDDLTGGMHGDEGETGTNAIDIATGVRISPFMTGWFSHPNISFFSIAAMMKIFGTGLIGLRMFSVVLGTLMVLPVYGLTKLWFGTRAAIIAGVLLAVMDVSIYFGKLGLNNNATPFFLVTGFYFLFKGLKSLRTLDFVLSGYAFMLTLYYYFAGRLTPYLVVATIGYLLLFLPLTRVPGSYFDIRRASPALGKLRALRDAFVFQARAAGQYVIKIVIFAIACVCMVSPWNVYYTDHKGEMDGRSNDKLILNPINEGRMTQQYGATHDPLYVGLRMPLPTDIYPWSPIVFENTPTSVQVTSDGFYARAVWGQLTTTLSMFTYRNDVSSFYTFTGEPATKPIEAALLILGIALAFWRWRDSRMSTLSIWFWGTVFAGGVFTIDAPYMPRLVGLVPALAILIAIPLNKIASEVMGAIGGLRVDERWARWRRLAGQAAVSLAILGLLINLSAHNINDYFNRYMNTWPYPDVAGQAYFVQGMNKTVQAEGRPVPYYFDLGIHMIYWGHGDNRFVNWQTPGSDMTNPANVMPVIDNGDRDVIFMVWNLNAGYLNTIKAYYPGGEEGTFSYGPDGGGPQLFTYYRVRKEQIEALRVTRASYVSAGGALTQRDELDFGSNGKPPDELVYPAQASWAGNVVAPSYGRYKFKLDSTVPGIVTIDNQQVLTDTNGGTKPEVELLLAKGPHEIRVQSTLQDANTKTNLLWSTGGREYSAVPRQYLWNGPGRSLYGEVSAYTGDLLAPPPDGAQRSVIAARVDGFLGFRHSPDALAGGTTRTTWTGILNVVQAGPYGFEVNSNGDSVVLIDNNLVVNNIHGSIDPRTATGIVELAPGSHSFEVRYNYTGGTGYLEVFWTPPNGIRSLIGPGALTTPGGVVDPNALVSEPPPVQIAPEAPATTIEPKATISGDIARPRGMAVDKSGSIYVGDRGNSRIVVYSSDGKVLRTWGRAAPVAAEGQAPPPFQPGEFGEINDVGVADDGTVYVFDNTQRVQAFKQDGSFIGSFPPDQLGLYGPNGIGVSGKGTGEKEAGVYIAVTGQNRILHTPTMDSVIGGQTTLVGGLEPIYIDPASGDYLEQPVDVVVDPSGSGKVYTIDLKNRLIQLTPPAEAGKPWTITRQWPVLVGREDGGSRLAMSADGTTVYMADPDKRRVAVIDVAKGETTFFGSEGSDPGKFRGPSGIAVGPDGSVYVLDRVNQNIQVFTLK